MISRKGLWRTVNHTLRWLLVALCLYASAFNGFAAEPVWVNIFGDGNPDNGIEDNRRQLLGGRHTASGLDDQLLNAGTIKCDGRIRGSAMVLDTRSIRPGFSGVVIASAAHVLYDLEKKSLFKRCEFHFLAMDQLASYRARIDMNMIRKGSFDPRDSSQDSHFGEGDWAFLYIPKAWRSYQAGHGLALAEFAMFERPALDQAGMEFRLLAYDSQARVISTSNHCNVVESSAGDLGGGSWEGQLLDDCDSLGGASGGGIVAVVNGTHSLVGIRSGSHWSEEQYPQDVYPGGPRDGSIWDPNTNTNFGRAIDTGIIREFHEFLHEIERLNKRF